MCRVSLLLSKMNPRNIMRSNGMGEFDVAHQEQTQPHQEPYNLLGSPPNFHQSSVCHILPASGSINYPHQMTQYPHQMHPVTNRELGIFPPCNYYYPYPNPASGPSSHCPMDQFPSSSSFGARANVSGFGMNYFIAECFRGSSKINGPEGFMENIQYFHAQNAGHVDGRVAIMDACHPMPQYRENYVGPSFQPPAANAVGDARFNCPPISPYFEGSSINGISSEIVNIRTQRFHEGASTSRSSLNLLPYDPMHHLLDERHPQNIQGGSRYSDYNTPLAVTAFDRNPHSSMQYAGISHPQQGPEPVPSIPGIRIYRSHRRSVTSEAAHRHHNLAHLRLLPEEGIAILEISGQYEVNGPIDHHRDMRLDIDYMSYEELLALSERIGNVSISHSEEVINSHLKTKVHRSPIGTTNLKELPCSEDKQNSCVICQHEYEDNDSIGSLGCGHEYHTACLKKWLLVKNECPICKSIALNVEETNTHKSG